MNKTGTAKTGTPLNFQKIKFFKYAKDTFVEILSQFLSGKPLFHDWKQKKHF